MRYLALVLVLPAACTTSQPVGLANPASVFCAEQGGTVVIEAEADGSRGSCVLPDGRKIDEWAFFSENAPQPPATGG